MLPDEITRFLILMGIFASVFLVIQVGLRITVESGARAGAVNKRLKMIGHGADREDIIRHLRKNDPLRLQEGGVFWNRVYRPFRRNLSMAAVPWSPPQVGMAMGAIFVALLLVVMLAAWRAHYSITAGVVLLIVAFAAAASIGVPIMAVSFLAERRRKQMQSQFPVSLDIFVRALRSGHPIPGAMELITEEMDDPIGSEFGLVSDEVAYGAELVDALNDMAERWDLDDIRMFVVSLSVQSETGGNLAEILENLSKVIRERSSLYLKVRALSSEGRMTGWLLTALPIIAFVSLFVINPPFYLKVAGDPIFFIGFPVLIGWYLVGFIAMRKMIDLKV